MCSHGEAFTPRSDEFLKIPAATNKGGLKEVIQEVRIDGIHLVTALELVNPPEQGIFEFMKEVQGGIPKTQKPTKTAILSVVN